jgi:hypothetical protein
MLKKKLVRRLASLKLAVLIILLLSALIAAGTIVEARYDATAASKLVYRTPWMYFIMALLVTNLTAVLVDRWPWRRQHLPFIFAHIGIIILLGGAVVSMNWGLDGSMRVPIHESNHRATVPITDLTVYASFDGQSFTKLFEKEVDFFKTSPIEKPLSIPVDDGEIRIVDYQPYALTSSKVVASHFAHAGAAVRFQIENPHINVNDWIIQKHEKDQAVKKLGPAKVHLVSQFPKTPRDENEIYLRPQESSVSYLIFYKNSRAPKSGVLREGETAATGWMNLQLKLLRYLPKAEMKWEFQTVERPTELTTSAIKVIFGDKEHWLALDDVYKLFTNKAVYFISYANRQVDLGFEVRLKEFEIGRYQGIQKASSYQSLVEIPGYGEKMISMNEPLKYKGLTVYQASFQEDESGVPVASIFSVNYDPGRPLKYGGSLIIVSGVILLFYNRRKTARALGPKDQQEVSL